MSNDRNDSNERGNDTAAAFQVGDTVSFVLSREPFNGHVYEVVGDIATIDSADGFIYHRPIASLTLISRAPAPSASAAASAPAQTVDSERIGACRVCECYRTRAECRQMERDETCVYICLVCGNTIDESDTGTPAPSEPATPAPAATPPALDTLQRALGAMDQAIHEALRTESIRESTVGDALEAIRQAVHALAKDHLARV